VKETDQGVRVAAFQGLGKIGDASVVLLLAETAAKAAPASSPSSLEEAPGVQEDCRLQDGGERSRGCQREPLPFAGRGGRSGHPGGDRQGAHASQGGIDPHSRGSGDNRGHPCLPSRGDGPRPRNSQCRALALGSTASPADAPALVGLLTQVPTTERPEAARALASVLRRSDTVSLQPVISAYQTAREPALRGALLAVLGQVGREDSLPSLRLALKDGDPEIRRGAILALTQWPTVTPGEDLLDAAQSDASANLQILALRGYIRLVGLEDNRPPAETLRMLSLAMGAAKRSEEKKAVLSLLARINSRGALALVEQAASDPEIAGEAKLAADQIREKLAPARKQQ